MTTRRRAVWALAAVVAVGVGVTLGLLTASDDASTGAPATAGPEGVDVPKLGKAANLPALQEDASTATTPTSVETTQPATVDEQTPTSETVEETTQEEPPEPPSETAPRTPPEDTITGGGH